MPPGRLALVMALAALWIGVIGWRLYQLQVAGHEDFASRARRQQQAVIAVEAPRGTIYDARGRELAVSVPTESVFADPARVTDPKQTALALAGILALSRPELEARLTSDKTFVYLQRKVDTQVTAAIRALALPGIGFLDDTRRDYPFGRLAGPVLGFVGTDGEGLAGIEYHHEKRIAGTRATRRLLRDAHRNLLVAPSALDSEAIPGADLHLTLDATLQDLAERALEEAVATWDASGGSVVLLDADDSAVLAMASYPGFDPNRFSEVPRERRGNPPVMDAYEPGSTFKMVTAAAALETSAVHPDDRFDCELGGITLQSTYIRDHLPFGWLTFREVIERSSNVGVIKVALRTGVDPFYRTTEGFGFGRPTGIDLPGESDGIVRGRESWRGLALAYASFGHGLSLTPLQLANAYAALVNGGRLNQPYVVRSVVRRGAGGSDQIEVARRPPAQAIPVSAHVRLELMRLLEGVVERGTGKAAAIGGYRVGGKTGTAEKSTRDGYSETGRLASFVGFAPARNPRLVAVVMIDEPRRAHGGGVVAAPVFSEVVGEALLYLGIAPDASEREERTDPLRVTDAGRGEPGAGGGPRRLRIPTRREPTQVASIAPLERPVGGGR
jgi:cell division protein FtsI/penicillin-binding protein 2